MLARDRVRRAAGRARAAADHPRWRRPPGEHRRARLPRVAGHASAAPPHFLPDLQQAEQGSVGGPDSLPTAQSLLRLAGSLAVRLTETVDERHARADRPCRRFSGCKSGMDGAHDVGAGPVPRPRAAETCCARDHGRPPPSPRRPGRSAAGRRSLERPRSCSQPGGSAFSFARARWRAAFMRLPHDDISHHRRLPGRERS